MVITSFSGTVTDGLGVGIPGVFVSAIDSLSGSGSGATTDSAGHYTVAALEPGTEQVSFLDSKNRYTPEWYPDVHPYVGGQSSAVPVAVGLGEHVTGIDAQLVMTSISATVTDDQGTALHGVYMFAVDAQGSYGASALSGCDGHYTITGLDAGAYTVSFIDSFGLHDPASTSTPVTVALGGAVVGVDQQLHTTGTQSVTCISGNVTNAGGNPIAGVHVLAVGTRSPSTVSRATTVTRDPRDLRRRLPTPVRGSHLHVSLRVVQRQDRSSVCRSGHREYWTRCQWDRCRVGQRVA